MTYKEVFKDVYQKQCKDCRLINFCDILNKEEPLPPFYQDLYKSEFCFNSKKEE